uniref:Uncharacterized protein n=1 Tax=Aegilops tauschii TaxID=37682 RepID=M8BLD0_AEGTA
MTHDTFEVGFADRTHIMVGSLVINWSMTKATSGRRVVEEKGCRFVLSEGDMVKAAKGKGYTLLDWEFGTLHAK